MMQKPRNSARMNTELEPNAASRIVPTIQIERTFLRLTSRSRDCASGVLAGRQVELHQLAAHLFHRHPFGLLGLRVAVVRCLVEARTRAPAELLGPEGGDIDEKKTIRDGRRRLDGFLDLRSVFLLRVSSSITSQDTGTYAASASSLIGIRDRRDSGLIPNPYPKSPVNVAAFRPRR